MPLAAVDPALPMSAHKLKADELSFTHGFRTDHTPTTEKFFEDASEIELSETESAETDEFEVIEDGEDDAEFMCVPLQHQQTRSLEFLPMSRWYSSIPAPATAPLSKPLPIPARRVEGCTDKELELNALSHEYEQRALGMFLRVKCFGDVSKLDAFLDEDLPELPQSKDARGTMDATYAHACEQEDLQFNLDLDLDS